MKINPGWRPLGGLKMTDNVNHQQIPQKGFSDMMSQQDEKATLEQLNRMLDRIDKQAQRLAKSMTVRELRQYKLMVKQFLEDTARRGIQLKDTKGWDRRGRSKRYKLLEEIDAHLVAMADNMLENEQGRIDILAKIGEIKGLLINYFF
jgi:hypothetical protein